jgi:DNA-binding SARP family transcriptional activator
VEFRVLGPLEVADAAGPVALGGPRERALLCALLLRANRVVTTDQLVEELWSGRPTPTAASAVRVYVSHVRRALGSQADDAPSVESRASGYVLTLDPARIDAHCFEEAVTAARGVLAPAPADAARALSAALELWRGPAYADVLDLGFAAAESARLEELRLHAVEDRIDAELALGRHDALAGELQGLVRDHPLREQLTAKLMLALYRSGRQSEALRAYTSTRTVLGEELGIEPGPALQELERAVLAHDEALAWVPDGTPGGPAPRALPLPPAVSGVAAGDFVGRRAELERLAQRWDECAGGARRLVTIDGAPGIGKTRLAIELAARVHTRPAFVLFGRSDEEPPWPYQPFREALAHYVCATPATQLEADLGLVARDLARLVPELAVRLPDLDAPIHVDVETQRYRLFEAVRALLLGAGRAAPVLLVLDDLQWADLPSLQLLQHVLRHPEGGPLMVVATCREDEARPEGALDTTLSRLARDGLSERMRLEGLGAADFAALMQVATPQESQAAVLSMASSLSELTEGNPFFGREVVRHLIETGSIEAGRTSGVAALELPVEVSKLLSRRLERLSPRCRELLLVAAVIGRQFDIALLARVCGGDMTEILTLVDEACVARVITELPPALDRYRFAHALVRESVYASVGASRRARLHLLVGEALEASIPRVATPAELAHHFCAAAPLGGTRRAVDYARRAADDALRKLAPNDAVDHYERAIRALELEEPVDRRELCDLVLRAGQARAQAGDRLGGRAALEDGAALAAELGEPELLAQASLSIDSHGLSMGLVDERLVAILGDALAGLRPVDHGLRSRVLARLARELFFSGDTARLERLGAEALEEAKSSGEPGAIAAALDARHLSLLGPEHVESRIEIAHEALTRAVEAREPLRELVARSELLVDLLEAGSIDRADEQIDAHRALADRIRRPRDVWHAIVLRAMRANLDGRLDESELIAGEALALGAQLGMIDAEAIFAIQLFAVRWAQGRLPELGGAVAELVTTSPGIPAWRCGLAMLHAEKGEHSEARAQLDALAMDDFGGLPRDWLWLAATTVASQATHVVGTTDEASALYRLMLPYARRNVVVGAGFACLGSAARYLGLLATTAGNWKDAESHFRAAIRMNDAMGAATWAAQTRYDLAVAQFDHSTEEADGTLELARAALTAAERFGMAGLADRARQLVDRARAVAPVVDNETNR